MLNIYRDFLLLTVSTSIGIILVAIGIILADIGIILVVN